MKNLLLLLAVAGSTQCGDTSDKTTLDRPELSPEYTTIVTESSDGSVMVWDSKGKRLYVISSNEAIKTKRDNSDILKQLIKSSTAPKRSIFQEALKTFGARFHAEMQG